MSPEVVVRTALELLDAEGMEGVTFRAVAKKLGIQPPALYWHFVNKRDLMDDLAQAILVGGGVDAIQPPQNPSEWKEWLGQSANTLRKALVAHRDGGRVVAGASFGRAKALARFTIVSTQVLKESGFGLAEAGLATATVVDYVWGYVIEEQEGRGPEPSGATATGANGTPRLAEKFPGEAFAVDPSVANLFRETMKEIHKLSEGQLFDWGLQVILKGLTSAKKSGRRAVVGPTV
ncbi:MAG: TetR/AcrR family transcriptional regulator C-terminal domain-containing protein [Thermoplasmata archaeon]